MCSRSPKVGNNHELDGEKNNLCDKSKLSDTFVKPKEKHVDKTTASSMAKEKVEGWLVEVHALD